MVFFVDGANELSHSVEKSSGTVRIIEASCDPVPRLVVEVDATRGSEVSAGSVKVVGGLDVTGS